MKKWIVGLGVVIGLLVVVAVVVPFVVPKETVKDEIIAQLESATGWRLRIDGDIDVSALPFLKLTAKDVGLGGEAGADGIEFITLREVRFGLSLTALLSGVVDVTGVTLVQPNLFLETDPAGRTSWEPRHALPGTAPREQPDQSAPAESGESGSIASSLDRLRFGTVEIVDGLAVWDDRVNGQKFTLAKINVRANMPSLRDAARIDGDITLNKTKIAFDLNASDPLALTENRQSGIRAEVSTDKGSVTIDGVMTPGPNPNFDGRVTAGADSLQELLASLQVPAPKMDGLGSFDLKTALSYRGNDVALSDFVLKLDETEMTGSLTGELGGDAPSVTGAFSISKIDVDRFQPKGGKKAKNKAEKTETAGKQEASPIDLAPLRSANADIGVKIGEISGGGVTVQGVDGRIKLADGKLDLNVAETRLFGGTASLVLAADGRNSVPTFSGKVKSSGLSVEEILTLAGRKDPVAGTIHTDLAFETKGKTPAALAGALALSGIAGLADGSVAGLGLAKSFGGDKSANRIDKVSIKARIPSLGEPIDVDGGMQWRGETFSLKATATPSALAAGAASPVNLRVKSRRVTLGFDGKASSAGALDGDVLVETPSVRGLAKWLGNPLPKGKGLEKFRFSGRLDLDEKSIAFDKAKISLDGTDGTGSGRVVLTGAVPKITAKLALDTLKLDPYMAGGRKGGGGGGGKKRAWSTEPIDFSGLKAVNADLDLSAKAIHYDKLKIGETKLAIKLNGGKLTTNLSQIKLYRGSGNGQIVLDGSGTSAAVDAKFKLKKLAAYPFLRDAAGFDYIEGAGDLEFALKTSGRSEKDFVSALGGDASFDFSNGAIRGVNIAKMLRSLTADILLGWQENKAEKTDFSIFTAKFKINKGIAKSTAFKLVGPLVRISGGGTVDMPKQNLDWKVDPKVVASLEGQSGKKKKKQKNKKKKDKTGDDDMVGFGVPVIIKGHWSSPKIYPDIKGILSNPQAAYDNLKSIGSELLGGAGDLGGMEELDGLVGGKKGKNAIDEATKELGLGSLIGDDKKSGKNKKKGKNRQKSDSEKLKDIDSIFKQLE